MSQFITTSLTNGYRSNVELLLQQKGAKIVRTVRRENQMNEFEFFDRLKPTTANEITDRHGDTVLVNTVHDRRRVHLRDFDWADLIDRQDDVRSLADFTSPYAMNGAMALGRSQDDVLIPAFFGNAISGKTGQTTVAFPAGQQIAANYVETGAPAASGLTVGKLRRARNLLESAEVDFDTEEAFIVVSPTQKQDLLQDSEVTSSDFNTVRALVNGDINAFMGFTFITSNRLAVDGSADRRIPVYVRSGMLFTSAIEIKTIIGPRADKRNQMQVYLCASFGATRMEEEKVVEIKCTES